MKPFTPRALGFFLVAITCISFSFAQSEASKPAIEEPAPLKDVRRIVCLGDSITQQGEAPGGYVWLVRKTLAVAFPQQPIEVLNAGISGHKSTDMLARFKRDVLDKSPDMVTISVGVNDVWHAFRDFANRRDYPDGSLPNGVPLDAYRRNVEAMIEMAEDAKIHVVMLSCTPIYENLSSPENARLATYNAALKDLARRHRCPFVNYTEPFQQLIALYRKETGSTDNLLTGDGVHMNKAGNRLMARHLLLGLGLTRPQLDTLHDQVEESPAK